MAKSNSTKSKNVCQVKDCEGKYHAKGWCIKHYTQMLRHSEINDERTIRLCSLDGCGRKHYAKDYCRKHYMQVWCYGKLLKHTKFDPNEFRFDGGDCHMMLYDQIGNPRVETVFDITDYEKVSAYKWCLVHNYCRCISLNIGLSVFLMSPIPEGLIVDHRNGDTLNNRRSNLRIATHSQNNQNAIIHSNNSSGFKGVYWNKKNQKWCVQIRADNKVYSIGSFVDKIIAAKAYNEKAIQLHGEFALLNDV